jgi:hypothetical protein
MAFKVYTQQYKVIGLVTPWPVIIFKFVYRSIELLKCWDEVFVCLSFLFAENLFESQVLAIHCTTRWRSYNIHSAFTDGSRYVDTIVGVIELLVSVIKPIFPLRSAIWVLLYGYNSGLF